MLATATATPAVGTCNGGLGAPTDLLQLTVTYPKGIYGYKKRCLYLLLILLMTAVVINMALTIWLIKILDLSSEGLGRMFITEEGIAVFSDAEFLETLSAKEILSKEHRGLKFESSRNATIMSKNKYGRISNILSLGEAGLQAIGNYFSVRGKEGDVLLHVDPQEMVVAANHMVIADSGGLNLDGSLHTSLVRGGTTKDLRLESPLKTVAVKGNEALQLESPAGGISSCSLRDMKLQSLEGRVTIDSSRLEMKNLITSWVISMKERFQAAYQVCTCENGRIFLAHKDGYCQISDTVCNDFSRQKAEPT